MYNVVPAGLQLLAVTTRFPSANHILYSDARAVLILSFQTHVARLETGEAKITVLVARVVGGDWLAGSYRLRRAGLI